MRYGEMEVGMPSIGDAELEDWDASRKCDVYVLNNDVTPMEIVIKALMLGFKLNEDDAYRITIAAHMNGSALVGRYRRDVAQTLVNRAKAYARKNGYKLDFRIVGSIRGR